MLAQSGVADEDTLYILARLMGGAKKRKKKTYTKPKKQKHKHKKIKLRVLKFFKVLLILQSTIVCTQAELTLYSWAQAQAPFSRQQEFCALIAAPCRSLQGRCGSGVIILACTYAGG